MHGIETMGPLSSRPQRVQRLRLDFVETNAERAREPVLRRSPDGGQAFEEIVRQQWSFSPEGAGRETEDHPVEPPAITVLELNITPGKSGKPAVATLERVGIA